MSKFVRGNHLPLPSSSSSSSRLSYKYDFHDMRIGEHFFIPTEDKVKDKNKACSAADKYRQRRDRNFKIIWRIEDDGVRIWCADRTLGPNEEK